MPEMDGIDAAREMNRAGPVPVILLSAHSEAELVQRGLDPRVPFPGFYSGVEIAPFAEGRSRPLDWTGVLTLLRRQD